MSGALTIIGVISICIAVASWFFVLFSVIMALRHTRPGVSVFWHDALWNPANNVLLRPSLLTEEGNAHRRRGLIAVVVFVISIGIPLFIASLAGKW